MKPSSWLSAILLLFSSLFFTSCPAVETPAISRQDIFVTVDPANHLLTGESTVVFSPASAEKASFRLSPGATGLFASVEERSAPFTFNGGVLTVDLPPGKGKGSVRMTIGYRCSFNDPVPEQVVTTEDPTYGVTGVISPRGVFLGGGAGWYPEPSAIPARRTVTVSAPAGFEAITAGKRLTHGTKKGITTSTWEVSVPIDDLPLSAGPYVIGEKELGVRSLFTYFYPENAHLSRRYLDAAADYIRLYEGLLGPYPFTKFAVVENFFPTGYGFPSFTLLGSAVIRLPFIIRTSLPHEIAHSWWGNGVRVYYREGNWSEGLVTYLADYLLEEKKSVQAGRDYRLKLLSDYASLVSPEREFPLRNFTGRIDPASRAIGYGKGAMVFHMVRTMVGDESFFRALRDVKEERLFKEASWGDFTRAFSKVAGRDFASFMGQWLDRPGGPRLALEGVTRSSDGRTWQVSGEVVQKSPSYTFPLKLLVETKGEDVRQTLAVSGERTPFKFSANAEPKRLLLDPDVELFRILSPGELPPTVNRIKGSRRLLVIVAKSCKAREETVKLFLESLGQRGASVVREELVDAGSLAGHDLLVCGIPERKGFLPGIPSGVTLTRKGFIVDRETFTGPDDLLFVVGGHPAAAEGVAALFLPLSETAATKGSLKITHYGKYGYLVFSAGENRGKGTLPPAQGEGITF